LAYGSWQFSRTRPTKHEGTSTCKSPRNKEITYILSPVDGELSKYTYKDKYET
jgi:hypothetical protein